MPFAHAGPFYLRSPEPVPACPAEAVEALRAEELCTVAAGPVFRHVGATFVEPTEPWYDPIEGATTDPYPSVPVVCASANVLVSVSAVASAMVVTLMVVIFMAYLRLHQIGDNRAIRSTVPFNSSLAGRHLAKLRFCNPA
jgi:hypothetical protein